MPSKVDYLFIGSFLSSQKGSLSASEIVAKNLNYKNIRLVSYKQHKLFRLIDILWSILNFNGKAIHVEVYSGQAFIIAELTAFMNRFKKKKLIFTLHGGMLAEFHQKHPLRVHNLLRKASTICSPSHYLKNYFTELGFKVEYVPNSIPLTTFPYNRSEVKPYSILWVRAFNHIYNPLLAVKIINQLIQKNPDVSLTMIGPDGGLMNETIELIAKLNLTEKIKLVGPVKNNELHTYYQTHQVLINTTSYESFGISLIEGASCGIPIVSSCVGEIPYLWQHGENMMLVNGFDERDFANMVYQIFEDKILAQKLSVEARKKAETYSWTSIEPAWIKLLELA